MDAPLMRFRLVLALCLLGASFISSSAQQPGEPPPSIFGTVTDVQNDAIPNAVVTLEGPAPADHASATTNAQGYFTFPDLRPDLAYHVTITAKDFAPWTSPALILQPGQQLNLGGIPLKIAVV